MWETLRVRSDIAEFRPQLASGTEVKRFHLRSGRDYAVVASPDGATHYRLEPGEADLLRLMDGTRSVKEIVVERLRETGDLDLSGVADLVRSLQQGGLLTTRYVDVPELVQGAMHRSPGVVAAAKRFATTLSIEWKSAHRSVAWTYRNLVRWVFTGPAAVVTTGVAAIGFAGFLVVYASGRFSLSGREAVLDSLILMGLNYLLTFLHELAHAVVLVHYGRRVKGAGFMLYFGSPAFFIDSTDGLLMEPRHRMLQSFGGPFAELVVAGLASLFVWLAPGAPVSPILYKFALLNYFVIFLNLVPLLELDGYWILSDLIQVPDLRPRSLRFMRYDLWRKLLARERFTRQEVGLTLYSLVGIAFTVFVVYLSVFFWIEVFGGLVSRLWGGGPLTRVVLLALAVFLAGPVLRAGIAVLRSAARKVRALWGRVRFRFETSWRVEAGRLIDALPIFDDLSEEVLSDLAGRVRLRNVPAGRPVVRQGERASAFYVIRRGTLEVVEEIGETGEERLLRVLGKGESFGELGLSEGRVRSATVRAAEDSQLFEIDKSTFDRLLADMVHVPEFAPTIQAIAELRELPIFSTLEPDELGELLEHGRWAQVPPGELIVEQGAVGDAFFVIGAGRVEVRQDGAVLRSLGPGAYFGEIALLMDVPRTASVTAVTPVRVFRLDREGFDRLVAEAFRKGTLRPSSQADRTWQH
ncbi:MAG TPA: cyclic nucleotide-binding domain-containing protein [Actinomycetota bacterium]|nr:cyclic nucleotide-binding domain-containing protein [Actinomycetota bacterium]